MVGLFEDYPLAADKHDEMFAYGERPEESVRTAYRHLSSTVEQVGWEDLQSRSEYLSSTYRDQGVTFDIAEHSSKLAPS